MAEHSVPDRKPLAPMESRDERITVRLTPTERVEWQRSADAEGEELSRHFRRCAVIGRKVREAQKLAQAASA